MTDEELEPIVEKYRQIIINHGGEVDQAGKWEKRRLAYEVKGRREGIFILMNFRSEPAAANELERNLKLDEAILRQIVVRFEPGKSMLIKLDKLTDARESESAKSEESSEAQKVEAVTEEVAAVETEKNPAAEEPAAEQAPAEDVASEETPAVEAEAATAPEETKDAETSQSE